MSKNDRNFKKDFGFQVSKLKISIIQYLKLMTEKYGQKIENSDLPFKMLKVEENESPTFCEIDLTYVSKEHLIDSNNLYYSFQALNTESLAELVDNLESKYKQQYGY